MSKGTWRARTEGFVARCRAAGLAATIPTPFPNRLTDSRGRWVFNNPGTSPHPWEATVLTGNPIGWGAAHRGPRGGG